MIRNPFAKCNCTPAEYLMVRALFIFGILALGITMMGMVLTSCSKNDDKKKYCEKMALGFMNVQLDNPETINVLAVSDLDSVYGKQFFNNEELYQIGENLKDFNERIWSNDNLDLDDPKTNAMMERALNASDVLRNVIDTDNANTEWSGWKMKMQYEAVDKAGETYKSERYFIFDKEKQYIIHSFEIPIL